MSMSVGASGAAVQTTDPRAQAASGLEDRAQLGKDTFLKLLVTQLRNQNPLEPMEDREFISQLATMNTAEQLTGLNGRVDGLMQMQAAGQANDLIGSEVTVLTVDGGEVTGIVDRIVFSEGTPLLEIDGTGYLLGQVKEVRAAGTGG